MLVTDVLELTKQMVDIPTVSEWSNKEACDLAQAQLEAMGFEVERLEYTSPNGELKVNLVGKLGTGEGGLAFCSHNDTVPGQEADWEPWNATIKDGRLYGRGSCDMKGPLAATMIAAGQIDASKLKEPIYIVITADEEVGLVGARHVTDHSKTLREGKPRHGVIAEPTEMIPVYAHKGYAGIQVTAIGEAAHSSTDKGISATMLLAPFMAEVVEFASQTKSDKSYQNDEFEPPTSGFNMTINDNNCAGNVTAAKTVLNISYRTMPDARSGDILEHIMDMAESRGFEVESDVVGALYCPVDTDIVKSAIEATGGRSPETVPYGTDGAFLQEIIPNLVILGPGDIGLAHRVNESIPVDELQWSVEVYKKMIEDLCM